MGSFQARGQEQTGLQASGSSPRESVPLGLQTPLELGKIAPASAGPSSGGQANFGGDLSPFLTLYPLLSSVCNLVSLELLVP